MPIRFVCLSLQNGRYEPETTGYKFHDNWKVVESTNLPFFNKDTPKTLKTLLIFNREQTITPESPCPTLANCVRILLRPTELRTSKGCETGLMAYRPYP